MDSLGGPPTRGEGLGKGIIRRILGSSVFLLYHKHRVGGPSNGFPTTLPYTTPPPRFPINELWSLLIVLRKEGGSREGGR